MRMWCHFGPAFPQGRGQGQDSSASYKQGCQQEVVASAHTLQVTSVTTINVNGLTLLSTFAWLSSCLSGPTPSEREGGKEEK